MNSVPKRRESKVAGQSDVHDATLVSEIPARDCQQLWGARAGRAICTCDKNIFY